MVNIKTMPTPIDEDSPTGLVLPAESIPDGATVTKLTGQAEYIIRHRLKLYQDQDSKARPPVEIAGTFLINPRGDIGQINPDLRLVWHATAGEIRDWLTEQIEGQEIPQ